MRSLLLEDRRDLSFLMEFDLEEAIALLLLYHHFIRGRRDSVLAG
jgi:hypothetical protein